MISLIQMTCWGGREWEWRWVKCFFFFFCIKAILTANIKKKKKKHHIDVVLCGICDDLYTIWTLVKLPCLGKSCLYVIASDLRSIQHESESLAKMNDDVMLFRFLYFSVLSTQ